MIKFIILTTPRTGSTYLGLWLNNHPNIRCHGEIFLRSYGAKDGFPIFSKSNIFYYFLYVVFGNRLSSRIPGNACLTCLMRKYFDSLYFDKHHSAPWVDMRTWNDYQKRDPDAIDKALGFKVMLNHIEDFYPLRKVFIDEGYKIIILTRDNILKSYLSSLLLKERKIAHTMKSQQAIKLHINQISLIRGLKKRKKDNSKLNALFPNNQIININYEELFGENDSLFDKLLSFIGVESEDICKPDLKKINPTDIKNIISNFDEIQQCLVNRGYGKYLA